MVMNMKKIVLFASTGLGHIKPMLLVADALVRRDVKVYFFAPSIYRDRVEELGAEFKNALLFEARFFQRIFMAFISYSNAVKKNGLEGIQNYINSLLNIFSHYSTNLYDEVKNLEPSCIVYDHILYFGKQLAYMLNIPCVAINTCYYYNPSWLESQTSYALKKNFLLTSTDVERAEISRAKIYEISEKCGNKKNLCPFDIFFYSCCMWGKSDADIVFYPKSFQLFQEGLDGSVHFCNSYTQDENEEDVQRFLKDFSLKEDDEIIYVSLGTSMVYKSDFFEKIANIFASTDYKVIMSVGNNVDCNQFQSFPENIRVEKFIDQLAALKFSSLYITHGGLAGVREALYFNVPMVVLPIGGDQFNIADAVAFYGNGESLNIETAAEKDIEEVAYRVLNNSIYMEKANELMHEIRNGTGEDSASEIILRIMK
jgi:MGT family glycosyltransferase